MRSFKTALRAAAITAIVGASGLAGALAYAYVAKPSPVIEMGPAAIAKLKRPSSLDPAAVRKRAHELGDAMDAPVYDITLSRRMTHIDVSAFQPTGQSFEGLRVPYDMRFRGIGLEQGDEIVGIDGFGVTYGALAAAVDGSFPHASILEVRRGNGTLIFCITWR